MFGYLLPEKQELKVKDFALYRAAYCGICRAIKLEYGDLPRFAVSYDAAVMAVLLMGVSGKAPVAKKRRCVLNPVRGKPVYEAHDALGYAAAVTVMLTWGKLKDAWADERRALALPAIAGLARANRKARKRRPALAKHIDACLNDLYALEKAGCGEIDRTADAMGRLMGGIFSSGPAPAERAETLGMLGYHIGRWIYLADALEDREKDAKSGAYNAVNAMIAAGGEARVAEKTCEFAMSQAAAVFDLMEWEWGRAVLENVVYAGMPAVFRRVTGKEKDSDDRPLESAWNQSGLK